MGSCAFDVGSDTTGNVCGLLAANVFDTLGRDTDDQTMGWKFLILGHQSAGGDMEPAPILTPLRTVAPMPTRQPAPISHPWTTALCPTTHPSPTTAGKPGSAWRTQPSWDVGAGRVLPAYGQLLPLLTPQEDTNRVGSKRISTRRRTLGGQVPGR